MEGLSTNSAVLTERMQKGFHKTFSHVYVEKEAMAYPLAQRILAVCYESVLITISHYKDVFCRSGQSYATQKNSPKLILAVNHDIDLYKGSDMCDDFGYANFHYVSHMMNCLYDCEYCYLAGMYPSANVVLFVNVDDYFIEVQKKLPSYICVSYDTDLMAFESMTGILSEWIGFCARHQDAVAEIRTKSNCYESISHLSPTNNVILAWSLSPNEVIKRYERGTTSLQARLRCIRAAALAGWRVRICIDPILASVSSHCRSSDDEWETVYTLAGQEINEALAGIKLEGVSIGTFRVPKDFYKRMKRIRPTSALLSYPFENRNGIMCYDKALEEKMIRVLEECMTGILDQSGMDANRGRGFNR